MKALVFGANGQDGPYLIEALRSRGVEATGFSRSGPWPRLDVSDREAVAGAIATARPDYVFQLAARSTTRHDALYENQEDLERDAILEMASEIGLDREKLLGDLEARAGLARVKEDFMSGVRSGVSGTPGFFINGKRYESSWDEETLLASLHAARGR